MAKTFRQRVAQAEAAARAEELRLQQEVNAIVPSPLNPCVCPRINLGTIDSFQDLFYKGSLLQFTRLG